MEHYRYICDSDRYHSIALPKSTPTSWENRFDGRSMADAWKPFRPEPYDREAMGNFPRFAGHLPVFDETAWNALAPLVKDHVEALPLLKPSPDWPPLYLINVTTVLDALDLEASRVDRLDENLILAIRKYAFKPQVVTGVPIFRIRGAALYTVIVSEDFKKSVERAGLDGLIWKTVSPAPA